MDFGSIIGFLAILFISSLFNKGKNTANQPARPNRPSSPVRPATSTSNTNKNRRSTFTGSLEDLFNELKGEFNQTFGGTEDRQSYSDMEQIKVDEDSLELNQRVNRPSHDSSEDESSIYEDNIYEKEIGKEQIPIEFNRKSIVQGVIMSEVLQKPKSLRR